MILLSNWDDPPSSRFGLTHESKILAKKTCLIGEFQAIFISVNPIKAKLHEQYVGKLFPYGILCDVNCIPDVNVT